MTTQEIITVLGGLFVTGLVMSLHCIGMCGPILLTFAQAFETTSLTVAGQPLARRRAMLHLDFLWYHLGRIWTYAMLGLAAGFVGAGVRHSSEWVGWHRAGGVAIGVVVLATGLFLLGVIPGLKPRSLHSSCALNRGRGWRWFQPLLTGQGAAARIILGMVMGFLPCGLVYAMLALCASLPSPLLSLLGMVVFGLGTLPSLTAVLFADRLIPARLRTQGTRLAAVMVMVMGAWMIGRSWYAPLQCHVPGLTWPPSLTATSIQSQ